METKTISVVLADDHYLVRKGFRVLLEVEETDQIEVVGEAENGKELLALLQKRPADVALLDVEMPVLNGIETCLLLKQQFPHVGVIMLTMRNDPDIVQQCVANGARGFLFKNASVAQLIEAIKQVAAGKNYFSSEIIPLLLNTPPSATQHTVALLSEREIEIIKLIAEGLSSTEIGEKLFISPRTVDTHRNNIFQKLQINSIAVLVRFAIQNKLI